MHDYLGLWPGLVDCLDELDIGFVIPFVCDVVVGVVIVRADVLFRKVSIRTLTHDG